MSKRSNQAKVNLISLATCEEALTKLRRESVWTMSIESIDGYQPSGRVEFSQTGECLLTDTSATASKPAHV